MTIFLQASQKSYMEAAHVIKNGGVVILPTETVYGIVGQYNNDQTFTRICHIKKRNITKKLTEHYSAYSSILRIINAPDNVKNLLKTLWPGPTVYVWNDKGTKRGMRVPWVSWMCIFHKMKVPCPLIITSANISNDITPTSLEHITSEITSQVDLIVYDGRSPLGIESTVIQYENNSINILRQGISMEKIIQNIDKYNISLNKNVSISTLNQDFIIDKNKNQATKGILLCGGNYIFEKYDYIYNLSIHNDMIEACHNLYYFMHKLINEDKAYVIKIRHIPHNILGDVIRFSFNRISQQYAL